MGSVSLKSHLNLNYNSISNHLKFIYSEKTTNFCEISNVDLSYVVTVKYAVEISQNFVAFSKYTKFNSIQDYEEYQKYQINFHYLPHYSRLKFRYCEKATKYEKISCFFKNYSINVQKNWIFKIFCAFLRISE